MLFPQGVPYCCPSPKRSGPARPLAMPELHAQRESSLARTITYSPPIISSGHHRRRAYGIIRNFPETLLCSTTKVVIMSNNCIIVTYVVCSLRPSMVQ